MVRAARPRCSGLGLETVLCQLMAGCSVLMGCVLLDLLSLEVVKEGWMVRGDMLGWMTAAVDLLQGKVV